MKKKRHIGFGIISSLVAAYPYIFFLIIFILYKMEEKKGASNIDSGPIIGIMMLVWIGIMFVGPILAIVRAGSEKNCGSQLAFWNMLIKLLLIPVHLFIAFCAVVSFLFSFIPVPLPFFMIGIPMMLFFFLIDGALILLTSIYGFAAAGRSCKDHIISGGFAAGMIIMHCFAVLDVISCVILMGVSKGGEVKRRAYIEGMQRAQAQAGMSGYGNMYRNF